MFLSCPGLHAILPDRNAIVTVTGMEQDIIVKDYYGLLGVDKSATLDEIRFAFRAMARKTHPDATKDPDNYEKFILIREAYDILSNPERRKIYDELWNLYLKQRGKEQRKSEDPFRDAFENFDTAKEYYREEWDYFIRHPDDYLGLFDGLMKIITSSFLSILAGFFATLGVFTMVLVGVPLAIAVGLFTAAAFVTTSMASIVLVIIALRLARRARTAVPAFIRKSTVFLSGVVVRPLRGIPREIGTNVLYFNYLVAISALMFFGYETVRWTTGEMGFSSGTGFEALKGPAGAAFIAASCVLLVGLFSASVPLMYEVIKEAMLAYPSIRYSKFRIRKRVGIEYAKDRGLPPGREGSRGPGPSKLLQ